MADETNSGPADGDVPETMPVKSMESGAVEFKACEASDLKFLGEGPGQIEGYVSTYGNWDRQHEMVQAGAFDEYLADFERDGFGAVGHDESGLPIFTINKAWSDANGLRVRADFHSTPQAQTARKIAQERAERGKSVSFSIGYIVKDDEYTPEGRVLKKVQPFEASLVNVPANPRAQVVSVKDGLRAGLSLEEHSDAALATVEEYAARVKALTELRAKEGRIISTANKDKLATIRDAMQNMMVLMEELIAAAEPKPAVPDPAAPTLGEAQKALADFLRTQFDQLLTGV